MGEELKSSDIQEMLEYDSDGESDISIVNNDEVPGRYYDEVSETENEVGLGLSTSTCGSPEHCVEMCNATGGLCLLAHHHPVMKVIPQTPVNLIVACL